MSLDIQWKEQDNVKVLLTEDEAPLKELIINYVGTKNDPSGSTVTVEMIINSLADEIPEVVYALAEENFVRGYEQGLQDMSNFEKE